MRALRARSWDALVVLLVLMVLVEVLTTDQDVPLALSVPVGLLMTVPLLWGQRNPAGVAAVVLGAWLVQAFAGDWDLEPQSALLPVCMVFWALGAYQPRAPALWSLLPAVGALVAHRPDDAIVLTPLMIGVFGAGRLMRSRERLAAALQEERAHAERYAVAEERARIARELHDVVGHALSVMTVQAGAERMAIGDANAETSRVLAQIEDTGRQALQEMRRMLGVLRLPDDGVDYAPQPGLGQVDALAERMARTGLEVDVRVSGEPLALPPGVDISAYRVVQEGLTNVLKHAGVDAATVVITHSPTHVDIEVSDRGHGLAPTPDGSGHGLAGMRERVALYGGTLVAGPAQAGGWRLTARFPREATS